MEAIFFWGKSYELRLTSAFGTTSPMHTYLRNLIVRFGGAIHTHKCILTKSVEFLVCELKSQNSVPFVKQLCSPLTSIGTITWLII